MTTGIVMALIVIAAAVMTGIVVLNARQQRSLTRANQVAPDRLTRAPRSWAVAHEPEAKIHRRLRDAMAALRAVEGVETGASLVLRVNLEQGALDLDEHLVAASRLPPAARAAQLQTITAVVECIERGVSHYVAATMPDAAALQADLTAAQQQLDAADDLRRQLRH